MTATMESVAGAPRQWFPEDVRALARFAQG
jgi:hypothetical protein